MKKLVKLIIALILFILILCVTGIPKLLSLLWYWKDVKSDPEESETHYIRAVLNVIFSIIEIEQD